MYYGILDRILEQKKKKKSIILKLRKPESMDISQK